MVVAAELGGDVHFLDVATGSPAHGWTAEGFNAFHAAEGEGFSDCTLPMGWKRVGRGVPDVPDVPFRPRPVWRMRPRRTP